MRFNTKLFAQSAIGIIVFLLFSILLNNLYVNLIRTDMGLSFKWLTSPSGFALSEYLLPYSPSNSYAWALIIGWLNSLKVILAGLILSTFIGTLTAYSRLSRNLLLKTLARLYVALIRQIPLLLQLLFWYFVGVLSLPKSGVGPLNDLIKITNQEISILGLNATPEFVALLIGLSVFTGASIAEVIRGGINSVGKGQWEAFQSLGIKDKQGLLKVILPQALPAIIPALTSQYLNLAKNSTLAIAVGYADIYAVSDTTITQTGRAVEGFVILLSSFLLLNLLITRVMEKLNKQVQIKGNIIS